MLSAVQKTDFYNSNPFDPIAKETSLGKTASWIVVIATSILSLGIIPSIAFSRTAWRQYHNLIETNRTIEAIINLFKKKVSTTTQKNATKTFTPLPLLSPSLKSSSLSSCCSTPRFGASPQLMVEDPFLRTLTWKLFPYRQEVLTPEEIQSGAETLKAKIAEVRAQSEEFVLNPDEVFVRSGEEPIKESVSLVLDYLLLIGEIGMYAKICSPDPTNITNQYLLILNPQITTSSRASLDPIDTATREFLENLDKYMYPKVEKMEKCAESNQTLNPLQLSLLLRELIQYNYEDFKRHTPGAPQIAIPHELTNRVFDVEPYLGQLRNQGIISFWRKTAQGSYSVIVDERYPIPEELWNGSVSPEDAQAFQEANKIMIAEELISEMVPAEQTAFRYLCEMLNKRVSNETLYIKLKDLSQASIEKILKVFNASQGLIICSQIEGGDPTVIKCVKSWRAS